MRTPHRSRGVRTPCRPTRRSSMAMARPAARPRRSRRWVVAGRLQSCRGHRRRAGARRCGPAPDPAGARTSRETRTVGVRRGPRGWRDRRRRHRGASHLPRLEGPAFDAIRGRVPNGSSAVVVIATATCTQCPRRSPAPPRPSTATARAGGGRRAAIRARRCAAKHDVAAARPGTRARSRPLERTIAHALAVDPRVDDDTIAVECFAGGHVVLPGSAAVFRA